MRAKAIKEYLPKPTLGKMVSYMLCINTLNASAAKGEREIAAAISSLLKRAPLGMINHTDHNGLRYLPRAVGIETKRCSKNYTEAEAAQMGSWLSAQ
ncbi:methyltransferase type 11 [Colletotrichum tofieldiae]|nr:methyltransferase type 11 [Colletotrichum tofieldiae]GKT81928.1 methyltransferase type 11 [Colletotrichum tofieldiae]